MGNKGLPLLPTDPPSLRVKGLVFFGEGEKPFVDKKLFSLPFPKKDVFGFAAGRNIQYSPQKNYFRRPSFSMRAR